MPTPIPPPATHSLRGRPQLHRTVVLDRGQLVAELNPTIAPTADLDTIRAAAERASHDLHRSLGRDDLYYRVQLHVARHDRAPTRLR
jgi:hypothetical protein